MLGSISPVGEASRKQRWWLTATAYSVASLMAGAATGALLGGAGQLLTAAVALPLTARLLAVGVIFLSGAAMDFGAVSRRLPTWHRQVDERWLGAYRGWVYGAGFGAQLGTGFATIITAAVTYAAFAAAFFSVSWVAGATVGLAFAAARTLPLLATAPLRSAAALHAMNARMAAAEPTADRVVAGGQLLSAVVAFAGVALLG